MKGPLKGLKTLSWRKYHLRHAMNVLPCGWAMQPVEQSGTHHTVAGLIHGQIPTIRDNPQMIHNTYRSNDRFIPTNLLYLILMSKNAHKVSGNFNLQFQQLGLLVGISTTQCNQVTQTYLSCIRGHSVCLDGALVGDWIAVGFHKHFGVSTSHVKVIGKSTNKTR